MFQPVFGAAAVVTFLNRAFYNTAPGSQFFQNQVNAAGRTEASQTAFALQFGRSFWSWSDAALANKVLGNMGLLPNSELEASLAEYFAAVGTEARGIVVLQLARLLSHQQNAVGDTASYADAAAAWNHAITQSYLYSANPANTKTADPLADVTAPEVTATTFNYAENQAAAYVIGKVTALDAIGVTNFDIVTGNSSGYFAIDAIGQLTLTEAGAAATAAANDYETSPNNFHLGVVAKDAAGNASSPAHITILVTDVDDVAPKLIAVAAAGTTVKLNFNEAFKTDFFLHETAFTVVDAANVAIGINSVTVSGSQVILTLAALPSGTIKVSYTAPTVGDALQDATGNQVPAISNQVAVTDVTAPTLVSSNPVDDSTNFLTNSHLRLTFSENVMLGSGYLTIVNPTDATDNRAIAVTDTTQVSVSGAVLTINPVANLRADTSYYIRIPSMAVLDTAGNPYSGISDTTTLNFTPVAPAVPGQTFALTGTIDAIEGTIDDDTIIGVFSTSPPGTLHIADQIYGGAGTDTLKMYGAYNAAQMPMSIRSVEILQFVTATNAALDLSPTLTKAISGVAKVMIDDAAAINGQAITTTTGQSLSLATGITGAATAGAVIWATQSTDPALELTLNGYQSNASSGLLQDLTISNGVTSTLHLVSTGAANKVANLTLGTQTDKLVLTGDKALTVSKNLVSSGGAGILKTVDASASTGSVAITIATGTTAAFTFTGGSGNDSITLNATSGAAFSFKGGAGNDTIKLVDNGLQVLASGTQLDGGAGTTDKISLNDTDLTASEYATLNAAKNFEVLGLNAAITVDASQLGAYKVYSLDGNALQVINQVATGTTVNVTTNHAADITVAAAVGVHDLVFNIGASTLGSNLTLSGFSTITLGSNSNSTIGQLTLRDNATVNITGSKDLTIQAIANASTVGHKIDASALTGKLNVTANQTPYAANSVLGDVLIGGNNTDTLTAGLNSTKLTGNGSNDTFDVSLAVAGGTANANITTITDFTKGDSIKFGNTAGSFTATKVDLSGATSEQMALDALLVGNNSDLKWGVYNGNTYIVDDAGTSNTMDPSDTIVKLTGILHLGASTFASQVLTFV